MTSKKAIFNVWAGSVLALCSTMFITACDMFPQKEVINQPRILPTPYGQPVLFAVVPFHNETGTTLVDSFTSAEQLAQQLQQIEGVTVISINRVIEAMEALQLPRVATPADAQALANALKVDGIIAGVVTDYDPYDPPRIGAAIQLFLTSSIASAPLDSRELTQAPSSDALPTHTQITLKPTAQASGFFDASNGQVLTNLKAYAHGRTPNDSPAGWRRYILSIDLFNEFVSFELTRRLFAAEWQRVRASKRDAITSNPEQSNNMAKH